MDRGALERTLASGAASLHCALEPDARAQLLEYLALLSRWNRAFNLTAVSDAASMVPRHLLDALAVLPDVIGPRVLDVGSGAGVPGLVLAIAAPTLELTLLEPSLKRTRFLTQAAHSLAVGNVQVVRARLESLEVAAHYDTVISRATMPAARLAHQARRLLTPRGRVLAMLGRDDPGLAAALGAGWQLTVRPLVVPGLGAERHLACMSPAPEVAPTRSAAVKSLG